MNSRGASPPGPRLEQPPGPRLARPVMRREFRKELRARLMSEAADVLAPRPRRQWLFSAAWLRPALAAAVLALFVAAGATNAAASSLPGDALYPVKRASEDMQLALTFNDVARLRLLSDLADRRLEELAGVARERPASAPSATAQYADAVEKVANAVEKVRGSETDDKLADAEAVVEAAQEKRLATLDSLKEKLPDNARPGVDRIIQREKDRRNTAPTQNEKNNDQKRPDNGKATPRGATPAPQRATPRPTPRATPTNKANDRDGG